MKARLDWLAPKALAAEEPVFAEVKAAFASTPALPREQPLTEREAMVRHWMALFRDRAPQSAESSLEKVEKIEVGELWPPSPHTLPPSKQRKKLLSQINGYSLLVSLALAVIATLSAAGAFWAPNSVWGSSPLDYLTAFLWGLGVHQVGGASIESLESLSKRFGGNIE